MSEPTTVGLSPTAKRHLTQISPMFQHDMDAVKFAFGFAVALGLEGKRRSATETGWNVGSFDRDGNLRKVAEALKGDFDKSAYVWAMELAEAGLEEMAKRVEDGTLDLNEILDRAATNAEGDPEADKNDKIDLQ